MDNVLVIPQKCVVDERGLLVYNAMGIQPMNVHGVRTQIVMEGIKEIKEGVYVREITFGLRFVA
jgi:hypothetical protein